MAENIKPEGTIGLELDIDVSAGTIDTKELTKKVSTELGKLTKKAHKIELHTEADLKLFKSIDTTYVKREIKKATDDIAAAIEAEKAKIGRGFAIDLQIGTTRNNLAQIIKKMIQDAEKVTDSEGKVLQARLDDVKNRLTATTSPLSKAQQTWAKQLLAGFKGQDIKKIEGTLNKISEKMELSLASVKRQGDEAVKHLRASREHLGEIVTEYGAKYQEAAVQIKAASQKIKESDAELKRSADGVAKSLELAKEKYRITHAEDSKSSLGEKQAATQAYVNSLNDLRARLSLIIKEEQALGQSTAELDQLFKDLNKEHDLYTKKLAAESGTTRLAHPDTSARQRAVEQIAQRAPGRATDVAVGAFQVLGSKEDPEFYLNSLVRAQRKAMEKYSQELGSQTADQESLAAQKEHIQWLKAEADATRKLIGEEKLVTAAKEAEAKALKTQITSGSFVENITKEIRAKERAGYPVSEIAPLETQREKGIAFKNARKALDEVVRFGEHTDAVLKDAGADASEKLKVINTELNKLDNALRRAREFPQQLQAETARMQERRGFLAPKVTELGTTTVQVTNLSKAFNALEKAELSVADSEYKLKNIGFGASAQDKAQALKALEKSYENLAVKLQHVIEAEKANARNGVGSAESVKRLSAARERIKELQGQMSGLNAVAVRLTQSFGLFFRYAVAYQSLYALTGAIRSSIKELLDFQNALIQIKSISNATQNEMRGMTAEIRRVAEATAFSSVEVAKGGQLLVQAGVEIKDFGATLKSVAQLAAATGSTFQQTADVMTTFLSVYEDSNPAQLADELRNAVNISKLSVGDLSTISNYLAEAGKSFNVSDKVLLAAAATLRNAGIKASTIGTGMRQALNELLSPDAKTLKALEIRYREIGNALSQEEIKGMFQGFQNAKDPLTAVLDELQRIGFGGAGAKTLTRVFDIRAENVIKALVQQRDEFERNKVAILESGTAAEGAKTQLESLETSAQNLGETIRGIGWTVMTEGIGTLVKYTQEATTAVEKFSKTIIDLKAQTGSTGVGGSIFTGAAATVLGLVKKLSVGKSVGAGALAGIAEGVLHIQWGDNPVIEKLTSAMETLSKVILASTFIKGAGSFIGRAAGGFSERLGGNGVAKSALDRFKSGQWAVPGGKGIAGAVDAAKGGLDFAKTLPDKLRALPGQFGSFTNNFVGALTGFFGKANLAIGSILLVEESFDSFVNRAKSAAEEADVKASAIEDQIQQLTEELTKSKEKQRVSEQRKGTIEQLRGQYQAATEGITLAGKPIGDEVRRILEANVGRQNALGTKGLADVAREVEKALGAKEGEVNQSDLLRAIQETGKAIQAAEASRAQYARRITDAYSKLKVDPNDENALGIVTAWEKLDAAERTRVLTKVQTLDEASKILGALASQDKSLDVIANLTDAEKGIAKKEEAIAKKRAEQIKQRLTAFANFEKQAKTNARIEGFYKESPIYDFAFGGLRSLFLDSAETLKKQAISSRAEIEGQLTELVLSGETAIVDKIVSDITDIAKSDRLIAKAFPPELLAQYQKQAQENYDALILAPLRKKYTAMLDEANNVKDKAPESFEDYIQKTAEADRRAEEAIAARNADLDKRRAEADKEFERTQRAMAEAGLAASQAGLTAEERAKREAEAKARTAEFQTAKARQAELNPEIGNIEEKMATLMLQLEPIIQKRVALQDKLATLEKSQEGTTTDILRVLDELYVTQEQELKAKKALVEKNLRESLRKESGVAREQFTDVGLKDLLAMADQLPESSKLRADKNFAQLYKTASETQSGLESIKAEKQIAVDKALSAKTSQDMAAIDRETLPIAEEIKALQIRLKDAHSARLVNVDKEVGILQEIYSLELQIAAKKRAALQRDIAPLMERAGLPVGADINDMLEQFSTEAGREALAQSEALATAYKQLVEAVNKEKDAHDHFTTAVDNAMRKQADANQKDATTKAEKAKTDVTKAESRLAEASQRLQQAQDRLSSALGDAAEDTASFSAMMRELRGTKVTAKDIRADVQAAVASGDRQALKKAQSEAFSAFKEGTLNRSEAERLVKQAQGGIEAYNQQNIANAQNRVLQEQEAVANFTTSLNEAKAKQEETTVALTKATEAMDKLTEAVNRSVGSAKANAAAKNVENQAETTVTPALQGYAKGGPILDRGTGKPDSTQIAATYGEYVQPVDAVNLYGQDFMDKLRNLQIDPKALDVAVNMPSLGGSTAGPQKSMQPLVFKIGDAMINTAAEPDAVKQFQNAIRIQAIKNGVRRA